MRIPPLLALAVALGLVAGCDALPAQIDLERMVDQRRYDPYESSPLFADGRAMRTPPEGTVARDDPGDDPVLVHGRDGGGYASRVPLPRTRALLERGRERFDVLCAACHGLKGDGESVVARFMQMRRPPSLLDPRIREMQPGRIFEVITHGYGLMRPYARDLPIEERWAVVAYLQALQLSQAARLEELPATVRERARGQLP